MKTIIIAALMCTLFGCNEGEIFSGHLKGQCLDPRFPEMELWIDQYALALNDDSGGYRQYSVHKIEYSKGQNVVTVYYTNIDNELTRLKIDKYYFWVENKKYKISHR